MRLSEAAVVDAQDLSAASQNLKGFIEAAKGESEELRKWKREKFDNQFAKHIHKYFIARKASGKHYLEEAAYKDLHFMTSKYLDLVGSVEFNSYMQGVVNKKLNLQNDSRFQAFLVDLLVNSVDFSTQSKARALALEKFVILTLQLDNPSFYKQFDDVKKMFMRELEANFGAGNANLANLLEDADFMLTFSVVSLAKNQNFFGQIDTYMKEFAGITLSIPEIS